MRQEGLPLKNPSDPIRNQTRDLPACSALPQRTAPPRTPPTYKGVRNLKISAPVDYSTSVERLCCTPCAINKSFRLSSRDFLLQSERRDVSQQTTSNLLMNRDPRTNTHNYSFRVKGIHLGSIRKGISFSRGFNYSVFHFPRTQYFGNVRGVLSTLRDIVGLSGQRAFKALKCKLNYYYGMLTLPVYTPLAITDVL